MKLMKKLSLGFCAIALAFVAFTASQARADVIIFNNQNGDSIIDGHNDGGIGTGTPTVPTTFTLASSTYITQISLYHYKDTTPSDTISLYLGAGLVGSFAAGPNPVVPFPYIQMLAIVNTTFGPGTYTIMDAGFDHWAFNAASGYQGFAIVYSGTAPIPTPVPGALALLGLGLAGIGGLRRKKMAA